MTPLLPNPDYYLHNLITMTSSESKGSGEELSKSTLIVNAFIVEELMNYNNSLLTMYALNVEGGRDETANVVPSCRRCNQEKGSKNWLDWMRSTFGITEREQTILSHIR